MEDVDGDGLPDLVTASELEHEVSVLIGNGDSSFHPQRVFGVGGRPRGLALADFDLNRTVDIVTSNDESIGDPAGFRSGSCPAGCSTCPLICAHLF